jgi:hypothetical protein
VKRRSDPSALNEVVAGLCAAAAAAWARGEEERADRLFAGAMRVVGDDEYVDPCPDGNCGEDPS